MHIPIQLEIASTHLRITTVCFVTLRFYPLGSRRAIDATAALLPRDEGKSRRADPSSGYQ